jgi:H+/Cl- antiporter ClcA
MAKMPADFVILFLATMMGALGGAFSTLRRLVEEGENPTPSDYVLRPALGFIVAIAVFTLFKAGQLVISSNVNAQSSDTLNPFLIAFIGVISGLVARQAVASIEAAGTRFFTARDAQKPVYGRELLANRITALSPADTATLLSKPVIKRASELQRSIEAVRQVRGSDNRQSCVTGSLPEREPLSFTSRPTPRTSPAGLPN